MCCGVGVLQEFLDPVRAAALVQEQQYQFVIDCIDSIAPKQALLLAGHAAGKWGIAVQVAACASQLCVIRQRGNPVS
jgi:tRNA A37 threonylcarbamoyladenosine dehydratase